MSKTCPETIVTEGGFFADFSAKVQVYELNQHARQLKNSEIPKVPISI
ncbi:MAG: hypothetical protein ABI262_10235 [Microcoleus sp.]